jgi:hypothetical protein
MDVGEIEWGVVDWTYLAQNMEGLCELGNQALGSRICWKVFQ